MSFSNFGDLKTAIATWLNRSDLVGYIPDFVRLAEQRIYYGGDAPLSTPALRVPALQTTATGTISSGTIALPTRFIELIRIVPAAGGTTYLPLEYLTPVQFTRYANDSDTPTKYTIKNGAIYTAGTGSASYTLDYYQSLALLSADADTNWILENAPSVYLYAALLEAAPFLVDDQRITTWHTMLKSAIGAVNRSANFQGGVLQVRPG